MVTCWQGRNAFRKAGKLDEMTKKLIDDVVEKCEISKKSAHSK